MISEFIDRKEEISLLEEEWAKEKGRVNSTLRKKKKKKKNRQDKTSAGIYKDKRPERDIFSFCYRSDLIRLVGGGIRERR